MIPKNALHNDEAEKELDKIKEIEKNVTEKISLRNKWIYTYNFKKFQKIKTFGRDIYEAKITIKEADEYQKDLLVEIMSFKKHAKPRTLEKK